MTDRKKELKEYLLKKKNLKEAQLKKKRPPFIVGIPHHGTSPILKDLTNTKKVQEKIRNPTPKKEVRSQRVTRASTRMDMGQNMKKIDSVLSVSKGNKNVKIAKTVNRVQKFPLENKATVSCNYFTFTWWLASNNQIMTCPCFLCMIPAITLWFDLKCFLLIVLNYLEFFKL